ncbi:testis-expressed protein 10 [Trichonephila inaurata madagascariensis]|uniref:Testis-expressed protein 10 n=1 Tax=Trichonephila inaurata madagascariensis TaxID=2747483 RepID=A0A8X6YE82_9ARAC|nr:testis-expressed protein 10 [Trichonephila inaurata madagascariensis]
MKKKQSKDFQKVKRKIGKPLPKGLNVTKTKFKSKKISFDRKYVPQAPTETSLKDILKVLNSKEVNIKYDNLRKLEKYVSNHEDTLSMYFPDILKELGHTLQDNDSKVRGESIELIGQCLNCLTEIQFQSFSTHLTLFLKCMMTRSISVQLDSLKLLDKLLDSHPKVMCHSVYILTNLLNLISSKPQGSGKKSEKRNLIELLNSKTNTDKLRREVLARMLTFLQAFTANDNTNDIMDDKEVHWDGKELLFLPLYRNSGTVPAKLDYSGYNQNSNYEEFKLFVLDLVPVLSAILKGVTGLSRKLEPMEKSIKIQLKCKLLNIITQILYCIGEWIHEISSKDKSMDLLTDSNFSNEIRVVCYQLMKDFPYSCDKSIESYEMEYMQINLTICYLYSKFIFETESEIGINLCRKLLLYIRDTSGIMSEKSVLLLLKASKNFIQSKNLEESAKNGLILSLYNILEAHQLHPLADILYSFFMDLSLNYDFKNLLDSDAMIVWFNSIFKELKFMVVSKVVKEKFLKYVQQVCARKYPCFMKQLNSFSTDILIEFLQFDDETFQLTVIHLIASLDVISPELLKVIAKTITHADFSLKTALKMIRFLHNRWKWENRSQCIVVVGEDLGYIKSVANIFFSKLGRDSFCDVRPVPEPKELLPLCNSVVEAQLGCLCTYEIYPHPVSKKHLKIFKVCFDCMMPYIRSRVIADCILCFVNLLCFRDKKLPAHSAIAIMELRKELDFLSSNEDLNIAVNEIYFSSTIYMSFITKAAPEESWDDYLLPQLQDCLCINGLAMIQKIKEKLSGYGKDELYLIVKVISYLFKCTDVTTQMDNDSVYKFFNALIAHSHEDRTLSNTLMALYRMWMQ